MHETWNSDKIEQEIYENSEKSCHWHYDINL